jgi:hypothetical protein
MDSSQEQNMTEERGYACAICGCDKFFVICLNKTCNLVCTGCGVRTTAAIEDRDTLVIQL